MCVLQPMASSSSHTTIADQIEDEENFINVQLRLDGKRLSHKFSLAEAGAGNADQRLSLVPEGKVMLTAAMVDAAAREVTDITVRPSPTIAMAASLR